MSQNTKQKILMNTSVWLLEIPNLNKCLLSVQIRFLHKIYFVYKFTEKRKEKGNLDFWAFQILKLPWKIVDLYWFKIDILNISYRGIPFDKWILMINLKIDTNKRYIY